jgi:hypothetical protein
LETRTSIKPKQRTGYVYYDKKRKTWTARLKYKDELGRTRNIRRQVGNKTEGNNLLKKLLNDIDQHSSTTIDGAKLTFTKLADICRDEKLIEPVYEDGVRVAGLRSYKTERRLSLSSRRAMQDAWRLFSATGRGRFGLGHQRPEDQERDSGDGCERKKRSLVARIFDDQAGQEHAR